MSRHSILAVTLVVSALAVNPLMGASYEPARCSDAKSGIHMSVSSEISSVLYDRGLEEEAAAVIAENFIKGRDERFSLVIKTLLGMEGVTKDALLEHLSTAALFREDVGLDSYADITDIVSKITQRPLDAKSAKLLETLSLDNA